MLRFPTKFETVDRGIGAHTDYGMLVLAAQDDVGGLYQHVFTVFPGDIL